jgi:cytochrome c
MQGRVVLPVLVGLAAAGLAGCGATALAARGHAAGKASQAAAGSPRRGRAVMLQYRCGRCHVIPGIRGARGLFGPPLTAMSRRTFLAGEVPNDPRHLMLWIEKPTALKPKTYMPDLGLTPQQAKDAAAYLDTLH